MFKKILSLPLGVGATGKGVLDRRDQRRRKITASYPFRNRTDRTVLEPLQGVFRRRSTHADLVSQGRVRDVFARNVARLHTVRCDFQVPGVSEYLYNRRFPVAQILRNTLRPIVAPPSSALASDVLHRIFG